MMPFTSWPLTSTHCEIGSSLSQFILLQQYDVVVVVNWDIIKSILQWHEYCNWQNPECTAYKCLKCYNIMSLLYANSQTWNWVCLVYCMIITWKPTKYRKGRTVVWCTFQISSDIASILYHQLILVFSILSSPLLLLFIIISYFIFLEVASKNTCICYWWFLFIGKKKMYFMIYQ